MKIPAIQHNFQTLAYQTKYHGPTMTKGARVSARNTLGRDSITVAYDYELTPAQNAYNAASQMFLKDYPAMADCLDFFKYIGTDNDSANYIFIFGV